MKKLLWLLLVPAFLFAQTPTKELIINPVIATTALDSLHIVSGVDTIWSGSRNVAATLIDTCYVLSGSAVIKARGLVGNFSLVPVGAGVTATSKGIPAGTWVRYHVNDTTLVLSAAATLTAVTQGDTLSFFIPAARFGSVVAGQRVVGAGIPWGTTVKSKIDSLTLVLSQLPTASGDATGARFGYFTSLQYSSGDALGFPFEIIDSVSGSSQMLFLQSVVVDDSSKQAANLELVLFKKKFIETADNAAFAVPDSSILQCVGVIPITSWYTFGDNSVGMATSENLGIGFPFFDKYHALYGQLVSRGTGTYLGVGALRLRLIFLRQ